MNHIHETEIMIIQIITDFVKFHLSKNNNKLGSLNIASNIIAKIYYLKGVPR